MNRENQEKEMQKIKKENDISFVHPFFFKFFIFFNNIYSSFYFFNYRYQFLGYIIFKNIKILLVFISF